MAKAMGIKWTREQSLIALNLYCKIPFGKLHKGNGLIIEVARKIGRTPSSLAMKLTNFASLDPVQRARGIRGLSGASKGDRAMWNEFQSNIDVLGPTSEQLLHDLFTDDADQEVDFLDRVRVRLERPVAMIKPNGPTESTATVRVRRGQQFFRQSILNAYRIRCCISGINIPRLLVASHIKPWSEFASERINPRNGLCLSAIHDAAFDAGLITLDEDFKMILSKQIKSYFPQQTLEQNFVPFAGNRIEMPHQLAEPSAEFLAYHRGEIFTG